jgi:hypothetical protein
MRFTGVCLAASCALLLGQAVARAESKETDPLRFYLEAMGYWTDNRDAWVDSAKESTWDLYIKPKVTVSHHGEQALIDLYYQPAYRYRSNPSDVQHNSQLEHDLGLNVRYQMTPITELRCLERFEYTDDPSVDQGGSTIRADQTYYLNNVELGWVQDVQRTRFDLYGRNMFRRYSDRDVGLNSDEDQTGVGVTAYHRLSPSFWALVLGSYTTYGFSSQYDFDRDFNALQGGVGLERAFSPNVSAGVKAGAQQARYKDSALSSQVVPFGELWLKGQTIPTTILTASLSHGVSAASAYPFASQKYTDLRGSAKWNATPRVILSVLGAYRLARYDGDKDLPGAVAAARESNPALADYLDAIGLQTSGNETTIEEEVSATFMMTENSSIKLAQRYENVRSDVGVSYKKNAVMLGVTKQF